MKSLLAAVFATHTTAMAGLREPMQPPDPPVVQSDRVEIGVHGKDSWTVEPAG